MIGYVTLEEAKEYINQRYELNMNDAELERSLYRALDVLEMIDVRDSGRSDKQTLNFPRLNDNEVPENVKIAQALEAYSVSQFSKTIESDLNEGIASRSIGDMSITYSNNTSKQRNDFKNETSRSIMNRYKRRVYDWR